MHVRMRNEPRRIPRITLNVLTAHVYSFVAKSAWTVVGERGAVTRRGGMGNRCAHGAGWRGTASL